MVATKSNCHVKKINPCCRLKQQAYSSYSTTQKAQKTSCDEKPNRDIPTYT